MFGWSRQEFLGRNIRCIVAAPHKKSHDDYLGHFAPERGVSHILGNGRLLMAERKDGGQFPVEVGISSFIGGAAVFHRLCARYDRAPVAF